MKTTRAIGLLLILLLASSARAQEDYTHHIVRIGRTELVSHHPACNPFSMESDPISWDHKVSVKAPRTVIHLGYKMLNTGIDVALKKIHTPDVVRWPIVHLGLPLTPHLLQMGRGLSSGGVYQLNFYDWIYDYDEKQPFEGITRQQVVRSVLIDIPLSCFARP